MEDNKEIITYDFSKKLTDRQKIELEKKVKLGGLRKSIYHDQHILQKELNMNVGLVLNIIFKFGKCNNNFIFVSRKDCNVSIYNYILNVNDIQRKVKNY